jgi:spermidine/putrescine transport system substrate-binding protein
MAGSRKRVVAAFGAVALMVVAAACGGDDEDGASEALDPDADLAAQTLTISNWDAYTPEGLIPAFTEAFGTEVNLTTHATNEEIVGKLLQSDGEGFDVAFVSAQFAQQLNEAGLLATLDDSLIPNRSKLAPEALELKTDPGLTFSIPYTWGTTGLCYRSDLVSEAPDSWMDLLRPSEDLVGKTTMLATDRWLLLPALKALGFSANSTDADELAQAKDLLIEAKGTLLAYDDTTFYSRLVSGEASLVEAWDGWCNYGIAENADIEFVVPSEGSDVFIDTMVILKSSTNKEAAHAFLNWVLEPTNHVQVAELVLYKVPNPEAMALLDPAVVEQFPNLGMSSADLLKQEELVDLGESTSIYTDIVTEVASS